MEILENCPKDCVRRHTCFKGQPLPANKRMCYVPELFPTELDILKIAVALLKITDPYKKDDRGYNRIDAWLFKYMLERNPADFSIHNLEWVRRKLLSYKRQIQDLKLSYEVLRLSVSDKAIYGWKVLEDSKFSGMDLKIGKDTRFTFKWRIFKEHRTQKIQVTMDRVEGVKFLIEHGFLKHDEDADGITEMKVTYPWTGNEKWLEGLLEKFGLSNRNSEEHKVEESKNA